MLLDQLMGFHANAIRSIAEIVQLRQPILQRKNNQLITRNIFVAARGGLKSYPSPTKAGS
jgi:hypothetical protein